MADGPTVVTTSGGGSIAVAVIIAVISLGVLLFAAGVIDFGGGGKDINIHVDMPKVDAPVAPIAPAPAAPAPANGG